MLAKSYRLLAEHRVRQNTRSLIAQRSTAQVVAFSTVPPPGNLDPERAVIPAPPFRWRESALSRTGGRKDNDWGPRHKKHVPGPLCPAAIEVQDKLAIQNLHPSDVLEEAAHESVLSLDVLHICLQAYFEQVHKLPESQRIHTIQQKPIAGTTLRHLWENDSLWVEFTLSDPDAHRWLCYFAVAEGLDDLVMNWVKIDLPSDAQTLFKGMSRDKIGVWRGFLFRCLVGAYLDHATNGKADRALRLFFDVLDTRTTAWRTIDRCPHVSELSIESLDLPQWFHLPMWPAAVEISHSLSRLAHPRTDTELYDRFVKYTERYVHKSTDAQRELAIARLRLAHPSNPTAAYAVIFLRKTFAGKNAEETRTFWAGREAGRDALFYTFRNAIAVARKTGLHQDVAWLTSKAAELFPDRQKTPRIR